MSRQSRFNAQYWMLGAGALGWPRGMVRGGRREEGSGWGTRVYLWRIHVDIWQNQYNIVKLKKKNKKLEWVAISFSNAWKWKVKAKSLCRAQLLTTPRTAAYQAPPSMGVSRQEYWSGLPLPSLFFNLNPFYFSFCQAGKGSAWNAGYPGLILGLGRSPGEVTAYPHQGFPGGGDVRESACSTGDLDSIPGLERSPGGGHGNPLQYSCLENSQGQRSLVCYSPWNHKESDTTEWLSTAQHKLV